MIGNICRLKPELLELHLQNICKLCQVSLENYIQIIDNTENLKHNLLDRVVYCIHNTIYISDLQPSLLTLYFLPFKKWKDNQINELHHSYNIHHLTQKNLEYLPMYLETVLFLERNYPNLSQIHLENMNKICRASSDFLSEYLSTIIENIGIEETSFFSFYINKTHNTYIIAEKYSELTDLYYDTYEALEDVQGNILCHVCNFCFISQKFPNLIKNYLESTLSLQDRKLNLSRLHLQNIKNICCSEPHLLNKYLLNILHCKYNRTQLMLHIQNTFNKYIP